MYTFRDTTDTSGGMSRPSEAMSINGEYIEDKIDGYRTLTVSGREALSSELTTLETGVADGSRYRSKRYPSRTITVKYQLLAKTNTEFRRAFNQLAHILNVEEAQLIFEDEPDMYFTGTPETIGDVEPGRNNITGEFEIFCADPFKYSVEEKEVEAVDGTVSINYEGTYPAHPVIEATMSSDNGFCGYYDGNKNILQFGNVDEADGEDYQQSEHLVDLQDFIDAADDTTGTDYMHPTHNVTGGLGTITWHSKKFLTISSNGKDTSVPNGGLRTITIPADSEGNLGAKSFYAYFHLAFTSGLMGQTGEMCINFLSDDNHLIAGVNWFKDDLTGDTGAYEIWGDGKILRTYTFSTADSAANPWAWDVGHCDIRKEAGKLTFYYNNTYPSFTLPNIADMVCTKIQISIKQYGTRKLLSELGFDVFSFKKMYVDKWRDTPNLFGAGDVLRVDGSSGEVLLNSMPKPELGAIGNAWEDFKISPGVNQFQCVNSEWATAPEYKFKYREVFM